MANRIQIIHGDITNFTGDAIVNAANNSLLGGGGVDGAIHRAAGLELLEECKQLHGCKTGEAKITKAYKLPAKWIIHTVGPIWHGGNSGEDQLLANCYINSLTLAVDKGIQSIAFPSISTGAYRFPVERAAKIAITQFDYFLRNNDSLSEIVIFTFDEDTYQHYVQAREIENVFHMKEY